MIYTICFYNVRVLSGFDVLANPITMCFFSEMLNWQNNYYILKKYNIILLIEIVMIMSVVILILHSHNCRSTSLIMRVVMEELLMKYFILFYGFICILHTKNVKVIADVIFWSLLLLTVFGIVNLIQHRAVFVDWALSGSGELNSRLQAMGERYSDNSRFRVQAMFANAFCYGYTCIAMLLFFLYLWKEKILDKNKIIIAIICSLYGIISCASRTVLLSCCIGVIVYGYRFYNLEKFVKYSLTFFMLSVCLFLLAPTVKEKVDFLFSAFNMDSSIGGSSLSMRLTQLQTVWGYITDHLWLGNGWGFFNIDLGFITGSSQDGDLHGLESVLFKLLLESGIVGLLFYLFFWLSLLIIIWKYRNSNERAFTIALISSYLSFSLMTGELKSWVITLLLIGCMWARLIRTERLNKLVVRIKRISKT